MQTCVRVVESGGGCLKRIERLREFDARVVREASEKVAARFALRPVEHDAVNAKRRDGPARNFDQFVIMRDRPDQRRRRA